MGRLRIFWRQGFLPTEPLSQQQMFLFKNLKNGPSEKESFLSQKPILGIKKLKISC
jgi:hypothetical protein